MATMIIPDQDLRLGTLKRLQNLDACIIISGLYS